MRLSFKKLDLFVTETVTLGVIHKFGGKQVMNTEKCEMIRNLTMPRDATDVRKFIGAICVTRNWLKNFAEIKRPFMTLTGKVLFTWGSRVQAAFQILKDDFVQVVEMHRWDFLKPVK